MVAIVREHRIDAEYDRAADVLYVSLGTPRESEGEDRPAGVVLRYGMDDNRPSGVTVIGFAENGWSRHKIKLAKIVSSHLSVSSSEVRSALERVASL